ncbi:MAG: DMT family transporter [Elusimicrobia bacterium]|nr:DMT family transporter [Elusimicrobiota bacterium]
MAVPSKNRNWLYFQVTFAAAVWGASYPFTKYLVTEISPLSIVTARTLIGVLLLLFLSGARLKAADCKPSLLWKVLLMSLLGVSIQQYVQAYALKYTQASHAGWLIATIPILVAGLMAAFGEKIGPFKIVAFILGFAGAVLVVFSKTGAAAFSLPSTRGDLIFMISCFAWAFYVLLNRKWLTFWPQAKVTTVTMLVALLTLLPAWLVSGGPAEFVRVTARGWVSLAYLGVLSTAFAYLFWNNSVEGLGPVTSSYFIYLQPFATLLSAYFFLGEAAAPSAIFGGLLILAGVYFVNINRVTGFRFQAAGPNGFKPD